MSRTDKDMPMNIKMADAGLDETVGYINNFKWNRCPFTNRERTVNLHSKDLKKIKRATAKRNRRRVEPHTSMRGYGWGADNYRYLFSD